jgi:hypothetical protein
LAFSSTVTLEMVRSYTALVSLWSTWQCNPEVHICHSHNHKKLKFIIVFIFIFWLKNIVLNSEFSLFSTCRTIQN